MTTPKESLEAGVALVERAAKSPTPPIPLLRDALDHFRHVDAALMNQESEAEAPEPEDAPETTIRIFGAADDLVEVEGDIIEEFAYQPEGQEPGFIGTSDGTIMTIEYGAGGIWRINKLRDGRAQFTKVEGQDDEQHSDVVTLAGNIRWVIFGVAILK